MAENVSITNEPAAESSRDRHLLSAIVDSSDDAIISKDLNGVITSWNKSAERLFGYTAPEAIGRTVAELLIPDDRQQEEPEILSRLRRGERVDHFETIRRRKDGTFLNISLTISPVKDGTGRIIGASKIARDITETKKMQSRLAESEARFRELADAMPQMVWTARPDGYVEYYNERWYQFTGMARDVFGDESWAPHLHPEDLRQTLDAYYLAVRSGALFNREYRLWDPQHGRWRWFISRALPVRDVDGKISRWFGTTTDIDEQKRVQESLQQANQNLEQFAFSASHDLQEPLRTIKIYSELLARRYASAFDEQGTQFMQMMRSGATRMEALVRDLLAYTQAGNKTGQEVETDANADLRAALENLAESIRASKAEIHAEQLPHIRARPAHLQQLFQNLIGNAIKYRSMNQAPRIEIGVQLVNGEWIFSVRDNGIGIAPEYRETVFGLFKRLHTFDAYSGTGIGLALCRRIVQQYGGRIWVESEVGEGSTFRFALPAAATAPVHSDC